MKKLRLFFTFYLNFAIPSIILSMAAATFVFLFGLAALALSWYFKSITLAIISFYINNHHKRDYYYYQNLGVSKTFLWISSTTADIALYLLLILIAYLCQTY